MATVARLRVAVFVKLALPIEPARFATTPAVDISFIAVDNAVKT
jgi:hypothetical protein